MLNSSDTDVGSGYDIDSLLQEAQIRWLKPAEVIHILQNHHKDQLTQEPPQKPNGGSLFLFNRVLLPHFRKDGHNWRKKKDGRTVGEAHGRYKVGNVEALNCYYALGEENPELQRRSYWMEDPAYEHIVLVHYGEITEEKYSRWKGRRDFLALQQEVVNILAYLRAQKEPAPVSAAPLSPVSYSVSWPPKSSPSSSRSIAGSSSSASFPTIQNQGSTSDSTCDYNRNWDLCVFVD